MFPVKKNAKTFGLNLCRYMINYCEEQIIMGFLYEIVRCVLLDYVMEPCL